LNSLAEKRKIKCRELRVRRELKGIKGQVFDL
jgi:hypothetical protein